jgi:3',5'-cyclic AMP phosphodiesterase CpdA
MRLVQISDTHLLAGGGVAAENLETMLEFINTTLRPDLVVHSGDVVGVNPDDADDRQAAVRALRSLDAPVLAVPGNHDVGGGEPSPWMGIAVSSERVAEHNRVFGSLPFLERFGDWDLVGLNSELLGSGLPEEEEQWERLEELLGSAAGGPLLLFTHRPLWPPRPDAPLVAIPGPARERLLALPGAARLRAVGSGHVHCFRARARPDDVLEVWAPATAVIPVVADEVFSDLTQCGVVEWVLDGERPRALFRAPVRGLQELPFEEIPEFSAAVEALSQ